MAIFAFSSGTLFGIRNGIIASLVGYVRCDEKLGQGRRKDEGVVNDMVGIGEDRNGFGAGTWFSM